MPQGLKMLYGMDEFDWVQYAISLENPRRYLQIGKPKNPELKVISVALVMELEDKLHTTTFTLSEEGAYVLSLALDEAIGEKRMMEIGDKFHEMAKAMNQPKKDEVPEV